MNLASVYDNLESYMKPVMKQNSQKLSVQQGGISGYLLMTDSDGEVFLSAGSPIHERNSWKPWGKAPFKQNSRYAEKRQLKRSDKAMR